MFGVFFWVCLWIWLVVLFIEGDSVWFGVAGLAMVVFWLDPPLAFAGEVKVASCCWNW